MTRKPSRNKLERACTRKQRHDSQTAAYAHLRAIQRDNPCYRGGVYECVCGGWHVGRAPRCIRQRIAARKRQREMTTTLGG